MVQVPSYSRRRTRRVSCSIAINRPWLSRECPFEYPDSVWYTLTWPSSSLHRSVRWFGMSLQIRQPQSPIQTGPSHQSARSLPMPCQMRCSVALPWSPLVSSDTETRDPSSRLRRGQSDPRRGTNTDPEVHGAATLLQTRFGRDPFLLGVGFPMGGAYGQSGARRTRGALVVRRAPGL